MREDVPTRLSVLFRNLERGLEFEIEVAEFDDPSDPISEKNQIIEIDPEYRQMASDPDFGLDYKLEMFRRIHFKKRSLIRVARYRYSLVECDKNEIILL